MGMRHLKLCCTGLNITMATKNLSSGSCAGKTLSKRDGPQDLPASII